MGQESGQRQKIDSLSNVIQNAAGKAHEITQCLDNGCLPDPEKLKNFINTLSNAEQLDSAIRAEFSTWEENKDVPQGSVADYISRLDKFSIKDKLEPWLESLNKFTKIYSEDSTFDGLLNDRQEEALRAIEALKCITDTDRLDEIQDKIEVFLVFVELLEDGKISMDDPRLETIAKKIGETMIYYGLTVGKFQIRQSDSVKTEVTPAKPIDAQKTEKVTENGIRIVSYKKIKVILDVFKKHLEKIPACPALVLSCATWLICFSVEDIISLLHHFHDNKYSDEELKNTINELVDKGYLVSFQLDDQNLIRFMLSPELKNAFGNPEIKKALKASGKTVVLTLKGNASSLYSITKTEVYFVEERNKALLDAIDYIGTNCGEQAVREKIIRPLDCNSYCYFTGDKGVVLLSKALLKSIGENTNEGNLASFLKKHNELIVLLTDIDLSEEANSLVDSCLPGRQCQTLPQFCITKEKTVPIPDNSSIAKEEKPELFESAAPKPENNLKTPEDIAKRIAEIDIQQDENNFYELCDKLVDTLLSTSAFKKDDDVPNRIVQALVFLYALASGKYKDEKKKEEYKRKSTQLQLATGLKLDDIQFKSEALGLAFPDSKDINIKIAAFLRAMFAPDGEKDYALYTLGEQLINAEQFKRYPPSLKGILNHLVTLKNTEKGFSAVVLDCFADQSTKQKRGEELARKASSFKKGPNIRARINGIKEFTDLCFGQHSDIYTIMTAIEEGDSAMRELVQDMVGELSDPEKIEEYIVKKWNQVKNPGRIQKLEHVARRQSVSWLERQRDLMTEWLNYSSMDKANISPEIGKAHGDLKRELPDTIASVSSAGKQSGDPLIYEALKYIEEALRIGKMPDQTWAYSEFLYSCEVEIDEDNMPEFPAFFESLPGMEAWRSVARHIAEPRIPLSSVLRRIMNKNDIYYYDNIKQGKRIEDCLIENGKMKPDEKIPWANNERGALENSKEHKEKLISEMELAFAYGRIEEQKKEELLSLELKFSQYFQESNYNFGHFHLVLSKFRTLLEKEKNIIGDRLRKRFKNSLERPQIDKKSLLVKEIEKLLQNANYNVAEEYINRLDSGEQELPSDQGTDEIDFFGDFLAKWQELSELCRRNKGNPLRNWGSENLIINSAWTVRQRESSRNLITNWPARRQDVNENNIKIFFNEIGFNVEEVRRKTSDPHLVFALQVKPPDFNQPDYRHPIAVFGTRIAQPVNVICLFGGHAVTDLIDIIVKQLHLGDNSIVLCDNAVSLEDRRKLVEDFHKKTSGRNGFLFIDQVLTLYLATLDISERMPAMLKATLPFSYCVPFNPGSGPIPDEMFFGRKTELEDILSDTGTNIVYGGRQLGKTALLLRARSIAHKPDNGEYAIYVDVKEKTPNEAVSEVYQKMREAKIPITISDVVNWEGLCPWIQDSLKKGKTKKLLFLIDEADTFLENDEKNRFTIIELMVNLRRQTNNRFKFVFAGLHNVARSKKAIEKNAVFPQMPKPLCIRPLSPMDARNLLKRPLSYLGFKMDHLKQIETILANTNYYPGILHFFGHTLIKTVFLEQYGDFYNSSTHPPYDLTDKQLRRIFSNNQLNKNIKEKINITLALDSRYMILANVIAFQYYIDENDEADKSKGYTVEQICEMCIKHQITPKENLTPENVANLLSEMADMGILWTNEDESLFRLRRSSFLGTIGTFEEVDKNISELGAKGFNP